MLPHISTKHNYSYTININGLQRFSIQSTGISMLPVFFQYLTPLNTFPYSLFIIDFPQEKNIVCFPKLMPVLQNPIHPNPVLMTIFSLAPLILREIYPSQLNTKKSYQYFILLHYCNNIFSYPYQKYITSTYAPLNILFRPQSMHQVKFTRVYSPNQ